MVTYAALVALAAVALIPRLVGLGGWELSGDDSYHALLGNAPTVGAIVAHVMHGDAHPPLFYFVLHLVPMLGGGGAMSFRIPAVVFGTLAIFSFFHLGRVATGSRVGGWIAALFAAFSPVLVLQSQTVRQYTLLVFLESVALAMFLRRFRAPAGEAPRRWLIPVYLAVSFLAANTYYASAMLIATTGIIGFVCLLRERAWRTAILWSAAHAAIAALWLVEIKAGPDTLRRADAFMGHALLHGFGDALAKLGYALSTVHLGATGPAPWLLVIPYVAGLVLAAVRRDWILIVLALTPLAFLITSDLIGAYPLAGIPRWAVWLVPAQILPIVSALTALIDAQPQGWRRLAVAAVLVAGFMVNQALAPDARLIAPDTMRALDEDGRHWLPAPAHRAAVAALAPFVPADGRVLVDQQEALRENLARQMGWPDDLLPVGTLVSCDESFRSPREILYCLTRQPATETWILSRVPLRRYDRVPCLGNAEAIAAGDAYTAFHVTPGRVEPRCFAH